MSLNQALVIGVCLPPQCMATLCLARNNAMDVYLRFVDGMSLVYPNSTIMGSGMISSPVIVANIANTSTQY